MPSSRAMDRLWHVKFHMVHSPALFPMEASEAATEHSNIHSPNRSRRPADSAQPDAEQEQEYSRQDHDDEVSVGHRSFIGFPDLLDDCRCLQASSIDITLDF